MEALKYIQLNSITSAQFSELSICGNITLALKKYI
jgi:hypothetical protein